MMNSLFAGVSGLRNHLTKMDVIANNIANINTVGFKAGRTTFKEMLAQTIKGASRQTATIGGVNPLQYGLGMAVASIDNIFSQGGLEMTGKTTDLAIQGNGFFILSDGVSDYYTRAGNFSCDAAGHLVDPGTGYILQGKMAVDGRLPSGTAIEDIQLPLGQTAPANPTTEIGYSGNLDAEASDPYSTTIKVYNSLGGTHTLTLEFTKTGANQWDWTADVTGAEAGTVSGDSGTVTFESDGSLDPTNFQYDEAATSFVFTPDNGAEEVSIAFDSGTGFSGLTQFRSASTAIAKSQNGYGMGTLDSISIDSSGVINGIFTNGVTRDLAQITLADFNNPAGLLKMGNNMYQESANSGQAVNGIARSTISGAISSGYLEMSNVNLAQQFTNMIIAQRAFQANARTITTTDDMLRELVTLKR